MPGGHGKGRGGKPSSKYNREKKGQLQTKSQDEQDNELAQFMSGLVLKKRFPSAANVKSFFGGALEDVNTIIIEDNGQQKIVQEPIADLLDQVFPDPSLKTMFVKYGTFTRLNLISMENTRKDVSEWIVQYMDTLNLTGFSQTPIRLRSHKLKLMYFTSMGYHPNITEQIHGFFYILVEEMCRTVAQYYHRIGANIDDEIAEESFCVHKEKFEQTMSGTHDIENVVISGFMQISPERYVSSFVYWNGGNVMLFLYEGEIDALKQVRCDGLYFPANKMQDFGYLEKNKEGITIEDVSDQEAQLLDNSTVPQDIFTTSRTQTFSYYDFIDFPDDRDVPEILTCGQLLNVAKEWISHVFTTISLTPTYYTGLSPVFNVEDIFKNQLEKRFFLYGALGFVDSFLNHMVTEISKGKPNAMSLYKYSRVSGLRYDERIHATYYTAYCKTSKQGHYASVHMICRDQGGIQIALEAGSFVGQLHYDRVRKLFMVVNDQDVNQRDAAYV